MILRALPLCLGLVLVIGSTAFAEDLTAQERHAIELAFLEGNLEHLARTEVHATTPDDRLPFAVRDLWWRPDPRAHARYEQDAQRAEGLVGERLAWLLSSAPRGPYPMPEVGGATDSWPMLSAMIEDRILRETTGPAGLPEASPIARLALILTALDEGVEGAVDEDTRHRLWYLNHTRNQLSEVALGPDPTPAELADAETARALRTRNSILAIIALVLLVAGSMFFGLRSHGEREPD